MELVANRWTIVFLGCALCAVACRGKKETAVDGAGTSTPVSGPVDAAKAPTEPPPAVAGIWVDDVGDAPWQSVELIPADERSGRYVGNGPCPTPPCAPQAEGEYALEGRRLSLRTDGAETDWFEVHVGGEKMEWRKDDVMQRRFRRVPPPRESIPDPTSLRYPPECAKPASGTACEKMTAAGCLWSPDCVLEALGPDAVAAPYRCRPAVPPCEGGIAQGDDRFEENCLAREGCRFRPSDCFCPSARTEVQPAPGSEEEDSIGRVSCACGGGPFRRCLPEETEASGAAPDV